MTNFYKKTVVISFLIFIALVSIIGFVVLRKMPLTTQPGAVAPTGTSKVVGSTISIEELAKHNTESDCYIAYQNEVFNISWFIPKHEGGKDIVQQCGQVVDEFSKIHPGGPFTKKAVQMVLQTSKVGTL